MAEWGTVFGNVEGTESASGEGCTGEKERKAWRELKQLSDIKANLPLILALACISGSLLRQSRNVADAATRFQLRSGYDR